MLGSLKRSLVPHTDIINTFSAIYVAWLPQNDPLCQPTVRKCIRYMWALTFHPSATGSYRGSNCVSQTFVPTTMCWLVECKMIWVWSDHQVLIGEMQYDLKSDLTTVCWLVECSMIWSLIWLPCIDWWNAVWSESDLTTVCWLVECGMIWVWSDYRVLTGGMQYDLKSALTTVCWLVECSMIWNLI